MAIVAGSSPASPTIRPRIYKDPAYDAIRYKVQLKQSRGYVLGIGVLVSKQTVKYKRV